MPSLLERARFWAAVPFVGPQGLWVRRRAPTVEPARGAPRGVVGAGEPVTLLAVGDSIITGVGAGTMDLSLPALFASHYAERFGRRVAWRAVGEIGARARDVCERVVVRDGRSLAFDIVLVSVGVNDVTGLTSTRAFAREVRALVAHLHGRAADATIVLAGIPPLERFPLLPEPLRSVLGWRAGILDAVLMDVAARTPGVCFVDTPFEARDTDFSPDGFHPNADAVSAWAAHLVRGLERDPLCASTKA
jgi:lysophospholipase L1-like esterase